jgi:crossover junction endodeoxyribonuclease RuvC
MTTLALDLGTNLGFAILRADGRVESGTERFDARGLEPKGTRWLRFRHWLIDMKAAHEPLTLIAFEEIVGHAPNATYAAHLYGGFVAHLEAFAAHHQIDVKGFHAGKIKKVWTGNGAAKKDQMVARAIELGFKISPRSHNEADAIALLHLALGRVPALPLERTVKPRPPRKNADTKTRELAVDPF